MAESPVMCYVAAKAGHDGYCAACADAPEFARDTARTLAEWVLEGYAVGRVTMEQARDGLRVYWLEKQAAAQPELPASA